MASFFHQFNAIGPLFVHLFNIINLNYGRPKHTRNAGTRPKQKHRRPEPRKHRIHLAVFHCFFRHYATFFEVFWIPLKCLPFVCFDILQHNGCRKIPKGPPFYIFRHCDTVQKSYFIFFRKFLKNLPRVPFIFHSYFATNWSFTKPKGSSFYNFEP